MLYSRHGAENAPKPASHARVRFAHTTQLRSLIFKTDYVLLGLSGVFFAISILVDVFEPGFLPFHLLEDGAKLAGILCWLAYFLRVAVSAVSDNLAPRSTAADV